MFFVNVSNGLPANFGNDPLKSGSDVIPGLLENNNNYILTMLIPLVYQVI